MFGYATPTMIAAKAKYPMLERGTYAIGRVMEGLRNEQGREQLLPLVEMYTYGYSGQGASQFAIHMQQLCLNAQRTVPALPKSGMKSHPGTVDACGIQLFVFKIDECLQENPSAFRASEFQALKDLKKLHADGKLRTFNAVLTWSKNTEGNGDLRPSPIRLGERGSGFLSQVPEETSHLPPHLRSMSPEEYANAVEFVAAQLTPDQFTTYFDRVASVALGYEYRLKSLYVVPKGGGKGQISVVYVHAPLEGRAKTMVMSLKQAISSKWNGGNNPKFNATVAEAKKIQFKHHPACKQPAKSGPSASARPPKSGTAYSDFKPASASDPAELSKTQGRKKANRASAPKKDAKKTSTQADQAATIAAAVAQGNSAFVTRLASLEKSLSELQASPSGSALSATQVSGPARKSTDEILAEIQSVLTSQQAQLHQLAKEQPSMFSGFHFDEPGVDGSK